LNITISKTPKSWSGTWTQPDKVLTEDGLDATCSTDSGTEDYGDFGFDLAASSVITDVLIHIKAYVSDSPQAIGVAISWNDGATWTVETTLGFVGPPYATWDLVATQKTNWTPEKLSHLKVRLVYHLTGGGGGGGPGHVIMWTAHVDFLRVDVTYTPSEGGGPIFWSKKVSWKGLTVGQVKRSQSARFTLRGSILQSRRIKNEIHGNTLKKVFKTAHAIGACSRFVVANVKMAGSCLQKTSCSIKASGICLKETAHKLSLQGRNYGWFVWHLLVDED
jgi:hypothetical protein